jgi:hypothetical protein
MSYKRVIPRDFFNEAKLLKCLGHFEICVLDRKCGGLDIQTELDGDTFEIRQNESDGSLYCANYLATLNGERLHLFTAYNDKSEYPFWCEYRGDVYLVFDKNGKFLPNFGESK